MLFFYQRMPQPLSPLQRVQLIKLVNGLPAGEFEALLFGLKPPDGTVPPSAGAQGNRAAVLLAWVEGTGGCGLDTFLETLNEVAPGIFKVQADRVPSLLALLPSIDFETITQAYRNALPQGRPRPIPNNLTALVKELADIPGEPDQPQPLARFVSVLSHAPAVSSEQQQTLRAWAEDQDMTLPEQANSETTENYLMIRVSPCAEGDPSSGYRLSAALITDPDPFAPETDWQSTPLPIPQIHPDAGSDYTPEDLPHMLSTLVIRCAVNHNLALADLTIQWFLPVELMSLPVEHWPLHLGKQQKPCNGQRCKAVLVRSYERQKPAGDYAAVAGDWRKHWTRFLDGHHHACKEALVTVKPDEGSTAIDWQKPSVIGCRFLEHRDPQQQEECWDDLFSQGLAIALWVRHQGADPKTAISIFKTVTQCPVKTLPLSLAAQRRVAFSKMAQAPEIEKLKAAPLSLLWDNPHRPFPTIKYESA
ncbi:MAG: hypothetical protein HC812_18315 [Leptolyngbya sp. RL_3_1]|nr:hypothetical protein [Leptolyngbya sp. RL_3_1]